MVLAEVVVSSGVAWILYIGLTSVVVTGAVAET